jgi:hypothetical protein
MKTKKKKAVRKKAAKKAVKRRTAKTKKSPLMKKIDEYKAVADKALRSAEEMSKKAKASKDVRMKRSYNYGAKQMTKIAETAQRKAAELIAKKTK